MIASRRKFLRTLGLGGAAVVTARAIAARGREALLASGEEPAAGVRIRLDSNENPNGPGPAALEGVRGALGLASRYPDEPEKDLQAAVARHLGLPAGNVLAGCDSTELIRMAVHAFTSPQRPLVTAAPTFEEPARQAGLVGAPVTAMPVGGDLRLDLEAMAAGSQGAGLVYLCNPNNPTATLHPAGAVRGFIAQVRKASPGAAILVDEAYHEYVEDPSHGTAIPVATEDPRVVVSRTFSKIHGLAGLRVGYAVGRPETLAAMERHKLASGVNALGASAAVASLGDRAHLERERALNREARELTRRAFESMGFRAAPSEANFLMVELRRDAREFQLACRRHGVMIGRPFPPLTGHARISIGTLDEMRRAVEVFRRVLQAS